MKRLFLTLSVAAAMLTSCSSDKEEQVIVANETYVNATSKTTWHYFSLAEGKLVGTGEENPTDNAAWFARKDWDLAVKRYLVRTNGGAATSVGAEGGLYTFGADVDYASVTKLPSEAVWVADKLVTMPDMDSPGNNVPVMINIVKSTAQVITFKLGTNNMPIMPPTYLSTPVYGLRSADGKSFYKLKFTQYQDAEKVTGQVKFKFEKIQ